MSTVLKNMHIPLSHGLDPVFPLQINLPLI